ncbi:ABC transporter ATP-binding protein [Sphingomonas arenae]|uniref:ABC transporter ATP-binding protein n=1 Tax=Sphingomonas arenae TaxID=2812555 RepID=UPI0019680C24|nr:ABC transporter ATP-binding protein [Sphingomonas arenae]
MTPLLRAAGVGMDGRLEPSDLDARAGTLTAIIGPNGGGKTSLLRAIARIDHPLGKVWIDGTDLDRATIPHRRTLFSFLPAARDVPWPIAARDVIALGLTRAEPDRVEALLDLLELGSLAGRPIDRLSTGERARVLLARALAPRPKVLLLDEPLSNLDPYWTLRILEILTQIAHDGSAVLVSLHDLNLLDRFDRAIVIADGRIVADGTPEQLQSGDRLSAVFGVEKTSAGWRIAGP